MGTVDLIVLRILIKTNNTFKNNRQNTKYRNLKTPSKTALYSISDILTQLNIINMFYQKLKHLISTKNEILIT